MKRFSFFSILALALMVTLGTSCKKDSMPNVCDRFRMEFPKGKVSTTEVRITYYKEVLGIKTPVTLPFPIEFVITTNEDDTQNWDTDTSVFGAKIGFLSNHNVLEPFDCPKGEILWNNQLGTVTIFDDGKFEIKVENELLIKGTLTT